jgi:hypothetical protein
MTYILNKSENLINELKTEQTINKNLSINYYENPYNHIVIDNLFSDEVYEELCDAFPSFIARSNKPYGESDSATSKYEAYITGLSLEDCLNNKYYDIFISSYLQKFLTSIFNTCTNNYIASSAHWHMSPSKSGFVHRDFAVCSFQKSNSIMLSDKYDYTDDSDTGGEVVEKTMRSIVLLYYLNNPIDIENYTGGGTGVYSSFKGGLIKEVRPKNNSLFAFEITPESYHAYVGANFNRSAIVQWYHSSPAYMLHRHWGKVKEFHQAHKRILDTWRPRNNYWKFENDPEYNKYFKDSIENMLK